MDREMPDPATDTGTPPNGGIPIKEVNVKLDIFVLIIDGMCKNTG